MRPAIALLLTGLVAIGGCDRPSQPPQQATQGNTAQAASTSAPKAGAVDRSHKGEAAPSLPLQDPAGKTVTLASFKGKPVLLNLWATWCIPCIKEMPTLDALAGQQGAALQVLAISQDFKGKEAVGPFFQNARFKHLQPYLDPDAAFSMGMGANLPTTILYDSSGKEVWRVLGEKNWAGADVSALIAEAR